VSKRGKKQKGNRFGKTARRKWFSVHHYKTGQHFFTLIDEPVLLHQVKALLKELVPRRTGKSALEIGPGEDPFLEMEGFDSVVYLDKSLAVARNLKKHVSTRAHVAVGDIQALPFSKNQSFGVVVVNEVLTHIRPENRLAIIKNLSALTDRLFIIDRHRVQKSDPSVYVNFNELQTFLTTQGWTVTQTVIDTERFQNLDDSYTILTARKK
jgi:SAM-dependent methyltransferase